MTRIKRSRYPHLHVAESTVNRILNVARQIRPEPSATLPPPTPNVAEQGVALDAKLNAPPAATELPAGTDGDLLTALVEGEEPATTVILPSDR